MGQASLILALSNKILDIIGTFVKPEAVVSRRRQKVIRYADLLSSSLTDFIEAKKDTGNAKQLNRAWALVVIRLARYKQIRRILK